MKRSFLLAFLTLATASALHAQSDATPSPPAPDSVTTTNPASTGPVIYPANNSAPAPVTSPAPDAASVSPTPPASDPAAAANATPASPIPTPAPNTSSATSPSSAPAEDIDDIRPPFFFLLSWTWLWLTLLALALIALLVGLFLWFKPRPVLAPRSAYDLALEKLQNARSLLDEQNPEPYAVAVSETIRNYLVQRFAAPSTRQTTEEFLREAQNATPLAGHRDLLRGFLEACDLLKFAHYQPGLDELEQVHQRALTFVTATKPAPAGGQP